MPAAIQPESLPNEAPGPILTGRFLESESDPHIVARHNLLAAGLVLPAPSNRVLPVRAAEFLETDWAEAVADLRATGLALVQLDEPLQADHFLALGRRLGTALPEMDPVVQPQVEQEVILNLVTRHGHTRDVSLQPFATGYLTLHTESSARPVATQPRYIVLMCCDPGEDSTAAQTVLVPMEMILGRMHAADLEVLARTRYRDSAGAPPIVRSVNGRTVFSFRDFHEQPPNWVHASANSSEEEVNASIRALLAAMYAPGGAAGVHWSRGMLVIIDNTFWLHGKTAGAVSATGRPRHLQRLRIIDPA